VIGTESEARVAAEPTDDGDRVEVSIVLPCLNEANSVGICVDKALEALRSAGLRGEVIVADNGSTDGSVELSRSHGARVIPATKRGYGQLSVRAFWRRTAASSSWVTPTTATISLKSEICGEMARGL